MKVAIVGSRTGFRYANIALGMMQVIENGNLPSAITEIVSGGAKGVDTFAERWAKFKNIPFKKITPRWTKYGKSAGMVRNEIIVDEVDLVVAFWDGRSKGTLHTYQLAEAAGKRIFLIKRVKPDKKKPIAGKKNFGYKNE